MIIKKFPTKLEVVQDDDTKIEITVMFIDKKLFNEGNVEIFVAVGYDSEMNIYESILNECKVVDIDAKAV